MPGINALRHAVGILFFTLSTMTHTLQIHGQDVQDTLVCGPRCVKNILESYGYDNVDLVSLVNEIQNGDITAGCSLRDIEKSLNRRGFHTYRTSGGLMRIPNWKSPVILHYSDHHFVVLHEISGISALVADGVGMNPRWESLLTNVALKSDAILFISNTKFEPGKISYLRWPRSLAGLTFVLLGMSVLFFLIRLKKRSRHSKMTIGSLGLSQPDSQFPTSS